MRVFRLIAFLTIAVGLWTFAAAQNPARFEIFPADASCRCIKTHHETKLVKATEASFGHTILQVFQDRQTGRELFRVPIGWIDKGREDKWENYGIAAEFDLNGDGLPDYSWYGGNDASFEMNLFLSSRTGYRKVDVIDLLQQALSRETHTKIENLGGNKPEANGINWQVAGVWIDKEPQALFVAARILKDSVPLSPLLTIRQPLPLK